VVHINHEDNNITKSLHNNRNQDEISNNSLNVDKWQQKRHAHYSFALTN